MVEFGRLVLKVLLPSFLLSWGIKAIAPQFGIAPDLTNVLLLVLIPPVAIAVWLTWQGLQGQESDQ
jgi:hypothetical protein